MRKLFLCYLTLISNLLCEPSAFKAGDLSVDKPYGLSSNEKLLLDNIKSVKHLKRDKNVINSDVDQLKSSLEGLRSVVSGLNLNKKKTQELIKRILQTQDDLEIESLDHKNKLLKFKDNMVALTSKLSILIKLQKKNYKKIEKRLLFFNKNLIIIKKNYNSLKSEIKQLRALLPTKFKKLNKNQANSKQSNEAIYQEALYALKVADYYVAIDKFTTSIANNYRPAKSHFYIGEAYYQLKKYKKAISYLKESFRRYKKGSYNAKLFLHMGVSLNKIGQKSKAIKIFRKIIKKYPNSIYAKSAKKYL